jgi:hypothetical protein
MIGRPAGRARGKLRRRQQVQAPAIPRNVFLLSSFTHEQPGSAGPPALLPGPVEDFR